MVSFSPCSRPEGYERRSSLNQKAKDKIAFETEYTLEQGLKETMEYYKNFIINSQKK